MIALLELLLELEDLEAEGVAGLLTLYRASLGTSQAGEGCSSGRSFSSSARRSAAENPVPTRPAYRGTGSSSASSSDARPLGSALLSRQPITTTSAVSMNGNLSQFGDRTPEL